MRNAIGASIAVAIALLAWSISTSVPAYADEAHIDLGPLILTGQEASSKDMVFDQVSSQAVEMTLTGFNMRQERRAFYEAVGGRAQLKIKLIEFTSNRAAGRITVRPSETTPAGFPPGAHFDADGSESGRITVDALKGRINVNLTLTPDDGVELSRPIADAVLRHVMAAQFEKLPMTGDLQSDEVNMTQRILITAPLAAVPIIAFWLVISSNLRDFGTLERLMPGQSRSRTTRFVDLTSATSRNRRKGLQRSIIQLLSATALVSAVALIPPLLGTRRSVVTLIGPSVALAVGITIYLIVTNRRGSGLPFRNEPRWPLIVGTVGAMVVLMGATYIFFGVIGMLTMVASWPIRLALFSIYAWIGMKLLRQAARPLRFAKQLVARNVEETLRTDPRQEVLLLRSFQDDSLMVRMHRTYRHSPIELASAQPFDRFEELLAWSLWRIGPVVAIGQPTTEEFLQPLGAAREFYSDDDWQEGAQARMRSSSLIVFVVGRSPGLWWEVNSVQRLGMLGKCLFVFPPIDYAELSKRLFVLAAALGMKPDELPPVDSAGRRLIGLHFADDGSPVLIGVDGRDDLAYQTMFELVGPMIALRDPSAVQPLIDVPATPTPAVSGYLETFQPHRGDPEPPTIFAGLIYVFFMLTRRIRRPRHRDHAA